MAEGSCLLSSWSGNRPQGSNPCPSAVLIYTPYSISRISKPRVLPRPPRRGRLDNMRFYFLTRAELRTSVTGIKYTLTSEVTMTGPARRCAGKRPQRSGETARRVMLLVAMYLVCGYATVQAQPVTLDVHTTNGTDTSYFGIPLEVNFRLDASGADWLEFLWIPLELHFTNGNLLGPLVANEEVVFLPAAMVFESMGAGYSEASDPDTVSILFVSFGNPHWTGASDLCRINVLPLDTGRVQFTTISLAPHGPLRGWAVIGGGPGGYVPVEWNAPTIVVEPCPSELMGDSNQDGTLTAGDIIYVINYTFKGGPPPLPVPLAGDINCDRRVTTADILALVAFLFRSGSAPCPCSNSGL